MTKLKENDIIEVFGWVMLAKLEPGKYRIKKIYEYNGKKAYSFSSPKGRKTIVNHYADSVDTWVGKSENLNRIEVLTT